MRKPIYLPLLSFSVIYVSFSALQPTQAGPISDLITNTKNHVTDKLSDLKRTLKSYASSMKDGAKTAFTLLNGKRQQVQTFIYQNSPRVVREGFDKVQSTYTVLSPSARKVVRYLLDHRDVVEDMIITGLESGKTIADIALDIAGFVPGANIPATVIKLAVIDFFLPVFTVGLEKAFERDQERMAMKRAALHRH